MSDPWQGVCLSAIEYAAAWLDVNGVRIPPKMVIGLWDATKTYNHYQRAIHRAVRDLFSGAMAERDFVDYFIDLIPQQLRRAWNEGMRLNGLDPETDMIQEWEDLLETYVFSEYNYVDGFAAAIVQASQAEKPSVDGMIARGDLWAQRYTDIVNEAKLQTAGSKDKYIWKLGATEEHCDTCAALDGIVAFAREWEQARFRPQQPPNEMLECGGWRCDCSLTLTDERRTARALDKLLEIATSKNV